MMRRQHRLLLNIAATYGRTVFSFLCGLFTARWALQALGEVDYGLYGVVGGLVFFINFFNAALSGSMSRFYAVAIGESGVEECRKWFTAALVIYTVLPLIMALVCVPAGVWAVAHWLDIPEGRFAACRAVLFCTAFSAVVAMACTPFYALYIAKQRIAELTLYSFAQTVLNVIVVYYMATHPGDWLSHYAIYRCLLFVVPLAIIVWRATCIFPECRIVRRNVDMGKRIKRLFSYAGWQLFGAGGMLCRNQLMQVLVNKFFGPSANAAQTVSNTVGGYAGTFAAELAGAYAPAVCTAYGEGDLSGMHEMGCRVSKFAILVSLILMLPLALELPEILRLWLGNPPAHASELVFFALAAILVGQSVSGQDVVSNATGRVAVYQAASGCLLMTALPMALCFAFAGADLPKVVGGALLASSMASAVARLVLARRMFGMGLRRWLFACLMPVVMVAAVSAAAGCVPRLLMTASPLRVCATVLMSELVFLPMAWRMVLDGGERRVVMEWASRCLGRLRVGE